MKSMRSFALNFYAPILVSAFLLFLIVFSPKFVVTSPDVMLRGEVSILAFKIPLPMWLDRLWLLRVLLVSASLASLMRALTLDFSKYFPTRLYMDTYFDVNGIKRNLANFTPSELADVSMASDWKDHLALYDEEAKSSLRMLWARRAQRDVPNIEDFSRDLVHARGSTTFIVRRIGLFSYRITESSGKLDYDWDIPKKPRRSFCTIFELRETVANYLHVNLRRLFTSPSFVLKPEFKQIFSIEAGGKYEAFDHIVVGLTKIVLLPFPRLSSTVYLWKLPDGRTVPVAYCVYIPDVPV